jgi:hypothetical protein
MKIALFGATGRIGRRLLYEALARGHQVTAIVRDPARLELNHHRLKIVRGDVLDQDIVAARAGRHDVVMSAVGVGRDAYPHMLVDAARSLLQGLEKAGVKRLIVVGGSGSLEVAPGVQFVDSPNFPEARKPFALAHRDALALYRTNTTLDWTYVSPAARIEPGERTGRYRTGGDQLITDARGQSFISIEDYAVAILDEVEKPSFIRQRFTVAY